MIFVRLFTIRAASCNRGGGPCSKNESHLGSKAIGGKLPGHRCWNDAQRCQKDFITRLKQELAERLRDQVDGFGGATGEDGFFNGGIEGRSYERRAPSKARVPTRIIHKRHDERWRFLPCNIDSCDR